MEKKELNRIISMYQEKMERIRQSEKSGEQASLDYMEALQSAMAKIIETNGEALIEIMNKNSNIESVEHAFNRLVRYTSNAKKMKTERLEKHESLSIDSTFRNVKGDEYQVDSSDWTDERNRHHAEVIDTISELLKESDRPIFKLYHVHGFNQDEIAERIGLSQRGIGKRLAVIATKINGAGLRDILDSKLSDNIGEVTGAKHHVDQSYDTNPSECKQIDPADYRTMLFDPPTDIQWARRLDIAVPTKTQDTIGVSLLGAIRCHDNGYRRMVE